MLPCFLKKNSLHFSLLFITLALLGGCADNNNNNFDKSGDGEDFPDYTVVNLEPGEDLETRAQLALFTADAKTIIQFPEGIYDFDAELSVSEDNIVIRGTGMDTEGGTVLRFDNQTVGAQGVFATGNNFVIEDIAIENTPGDGIKVDGSNGVTIRRVRMEWTNGPDENNGAYGLYPVQTRNVLIEDTWVRGASDAGVYVGQSELIIVRRNYVTENVAGIEIENSKYADVYENETTGNTAGILVFDLPGPPIQGGAATRVFNNEVYDNNEPNFAPEGNIVGTVPTGTGIMIMANDDDEIFGNTITGNKSAGILIVSYYFVDTGEDKEGYDPIPEKIYIHDNIMSNNAYDPVDDAALIALFFEDGLPTIFYDSSGVGLEMGLAVEYPDGLSEAQAICALDEGSETIWGQLNAAALLSGDFDNANISTDKELFDCTHVSLPPVELEPPVDPEGGGGPNPEVLCDTDQEGLNADAYQADCPNLSDYGLFADPANPLADANGGIIYDLNTPLFTDYAVKYRFVFVPEGSEAIYRDQDVFDFPIGTIIAKTFTIQADLRDPSSAEEIIETRLLLLRKEGWTALPYIWNDDKTDAVLSVAGGSQFVEWIDANGMEQSTDYVIPNTNNCANCHNLRDAILPIGPKARHLNKDYAYASGDANQLDYWAEQGILTEVPDDKSTIVTIPLWGDDTASLDDRARGYLDINCMHCHTPDGAADTSGLYLEYFRPFGVEVGECKTPIAAGAGSGGLLYDIVPGNAAESIMDYRMDSNAPAVRMPEIGRSIIHTEGVELIRAWINAMPANDCT